MIRNIGILISAMLGLLLCGCGQEPGVIFPPQPQQLVWPDPPDPARISYVGQLTADADLKPGRSSLDLIGQAFFGKPEVHPMVKPFALCTDGADRLFVADSALRQVQVYDLKTRQFEQWKPREKDPAFAQPVAVAWDPSGRLLVCDSVAAAIFVFDAKGHYCGQLGRGMLKRPCGIAIDPAGKRLFVVDSAAHQIVVLSSSGQELKRIGQRGTAPGQFNFPTNVAIDHQGRLYVADALNFRVQQFSPDLTAIQIIGNKGDTAGSFEQPKCLAVDSEDHLYVVDNRFEAVQIFDAQGQLLLAFGKEGHGPGEFWLPTGIFIDARNRIWLADSYNRRVQVFDYLPAAPAAEVQLPESKQ